MTRINERDTFVHYVHMCECEYDECVHVLVVIIIVVVVVAVVVVVVVGRLYTVYSVCLCMCVAVLDMQYMRSKWDKEHQISKNFETNQTQVLLVKLGGIGSHNTRLYTQTGRLQDVPVPTDSSISNELLEYSLQWENTAWFDDECLEEPIVPNSLKTNCFVIFG